MPNFPGLSFKNSAGGSSTWPTWDGSLDGTPVAFESGTATPTQRVSSCLLTTDKVIIVYQYNGKLQARVETFSDTAITVGIAVDVYASAPKSCSVCAFDSTRALCVYIDALNVVQGVILSVSGTTITVNTATPIGAGTQTQVSVANLTTNTAIVAYTEGSSVYAVIVTAVTTVVVTNAAVDVGSSVAALRVSVAVLDSTHAIIAYSAGTNTDGLCRIISVSGTTPSAPTAATTFATHDSGANIREISVGALDSAHAMITFVNGGDSFGKNIALSVSGTTITLGSLATFQSSATSFDANGITSEFAVIDASTALIVFSASSHTYGVVTTISGTTVTNNSRVQISTADSQYFDAAVAIDTGRVLGLYSNASNTGNSIILKK